MNRLARRIREFFFLSRTLASWEAGFEGIEIPDKPGWKGIDFRDGSFHFRQEYSILEPKSQRFVSSSTISFQEEPKWRMKCGGRRNEMTKSFLERALMSNYLNGVFIGGRGPEKFLHPDFPDYAYANNIFSNAFGGFHGHDQVHFNIDGPNGAGNGSGKVISEIFSFCNYHGGSIHGSK